MKNIVIASICLLFFIILSIQVRGQPPQDVFNGVYKASIPKDTLVFKVQGHTVSQREYDLYKQLKRLFVSGKVTLENPLCDSIIKAQANEIDLSYRYSDSLEIKMQALNRTAIDYQIEVQNILSEQRKVNDNLLGKIHDISDELEEAEISWSSEKVRADNYERKSSWRGKVIIGLIGVIKATGVYIYFTQ